MPHPAALAFEILPDQRRLWVGGEERAVGARAFDVLAYLHRNAGRVVTKAELLEHVWSDLNVEESNLTVQIAALRKLLGHRAVATVPGVGYQLTLEAKAPTDPSETLPLPDKPSLAVLPFANLTGNGSQDYVVDGIVFDLIAALSHIPAVFVIAASSTFTLKGQSLDLADVGRRLGVRYILEGGIQQAGDRLRINTQLIEAETGHTIWSNRFSGALADIFELQDRVVEGVAAAIEPNVMLAESLRANTKPTNHLGAYDLCLQALPRAFRLADMESFQFARDRLRQALVVDPDYVYAKALLCRLHTGAYSSRWITFEEAGTILPLAEEVLADHREDPLALAFAGHTIGLLAHQHERGRNAVARAASLNPNSTLVLFHSGWGHLYAGEGAIAEEHFRRAIRLNPLDPYIANTFSGRGAALCQLGRYEEAIEAFEQARAGAPEYAATYIGLTLAYCKLGQIEKARVACEKLLEKAPTMTISGFLRNAPFHTGSWRRDLEKAFRALGVPE